MSQFKDHFSHDSGSYSRYRPRYPSALFDFLASSCQETRWAWDLACGSGQSAVELARRFRRASASDASYRQIDRAVKAANLTYSVGPAHSIDAEDGALDLVTVAQALHWFEVDEVFTEVDRVLKPGGLLAVWGYQLLSIDPSVDNLVRSFEASVVGDYWPPERAILESGYRGVSFPYSQIATPLFQMSTDWSLEEVVGYLGTWSSVRGYRKAVGGDPLPSLRARMSSVWGDDASKKTVTWPLHLWLGRKPTLR